MIFPCVRVRLEFLQDSNSHMLLQSLSIPFLLLILKSRALVSVNAIVLNKFTAVRGYFHGHFLALGPAATGIDLLAACMVHCSQAHLNEPRLAVKYESQSKSCTCGTYGHYDLGHWNDTTEEDPVYALDHQPLEIVNYQGPVVI